MVTSLYICAMVSYFIHNFYLHVSTETGLSSTSNDVVITLCFPSLAEKWRSPHPAAQRQTESGDPSLPASVQL